MKKIYLVFSLALSVVFNSALAQTASVLLIPNVGSSVAFPSITSAYAAIPSSPTMSYTIEILPIYNGTDASEVYPILLTDKGITPGSATIITIRPSLANNGEVIQRPTPAFGPVVSFDGGDNVILDGRPGSVTSTSTNYLTVNQPFTTTAALPAGALFRNIDFVNAASSNTVQYVNAVAAAANATTGAQNIVIGSTITTGNNNNKILNSIVSGAARGIQDFGLSAAVPNSGTILLGNTVKDYSGIGIFVGTQTNATVSNNLLQITGTALFGNSLEGIRNQAPAGVSTIADNTINISTTSTTITSLSGIVTTILGTETISGNNINALSAPSATSITGLSLNVSTATAGNTFNITRNRFSGLTSGGAAQILGMLFTPNTGSVLNVNNNFMSITDPNTTATLMSGIYFNVRTGANYTSNVYYNSVRIGGTHTTGTTASISSYGINRADNNAASVFNMKNNIVLMERSSSSPALMAGFFNSSASGILDVDYNNYFAPVTATNAYAAGWVDAVYNDLAAYKTRATPYEQNSTFTAANFVSNTDLHLTGASITEPTLKGIPIAGITIDIDNNTRSTTAPYKGADEAGLPLPIQLFTFSGVSKGTYNQLSWSTASEINNSGFELQRSVDGKDFRTISFILSKSENGNSVIGLNYSYNDLKPFSTSSYYRIKQVDKDGHFVYSSIALIKGNGVMAVEISNLYPNPVKSVFDVVIGSPKEGTISMIVTDAVGRNVMNKTVKVNKGDNIISLQANTLQSGIYMLRIVHQETMETANIQFIK